jgi:VIT1/CCC1 family predicted Fe2+/Mn2+ transporter
MAVYRDAVSRGMAREARVLRPEHHHRDIQGGAARAAVFGVSDGLVSNVSLILGMAGAASDQPGIVRLAGLAGLIAGSVSMAAGEFVSMKAQRELFERELDMERREIRRRPLVEQAELADIYRSRGVSPDIAQQLAGEMMRDPDLALETHAREELGIDPGSLGSPNRAAASSFVTFALGALVPLLPWFFAQGDVATVVSLVLAGLTAIGVGCVLARFTGRSRLFTASRQLAFAVVPAAITFGIGTAVGVGIT